MPQPQDSDFYTVAQAAKALEVSPVTIWRWIRADLLPAYRAGPKNIRIKKADLDRVLAPAREHSAKAGARGELGSVPTSAMSASIVVRSLTQEEVQRGLQALEQARASRAQMLAERGGEPLASSAPIIRQSRALRSRRLR